MRFISRNECITVAVDFTASNGLIDSSSSLHYFDIYGNKQNPYEEALSTISSILVNYDSDQLISAYGFGGVPKYLKSRQVSHCFNLNGTENPQCISSFGLMEAYKYTLSNCYLSGPTFFTPCLKVILAKSSHIKY